MANEPTHQSPETERTDSSYRTLITWLTVHLVRAGRVLVYSSVYISLVAVTEAVIATILLSLPLTLAPVVVGLVTFAVYTADRLADADTDAVSNPRQAAFMRRHEGVLSLSSAAAYGLAVTLSVLGGPLALGITLLPGVFWVLYASDWIPDVGLHVRRLKQILVVNSAVVALAWALTLTFLPIVFADGRFTSAAGVAFAYFFLRSFVDTEIPNVNDVEADRATDVVTIPVVAGVRRTRHALYGVDLATLGLVWYATVTDLVPVALSVALGIGLAYSLGITSFLGRFEDDALLAKLPECEYVFVGVTLVSSILAA